MSTVARARDASCASRHARSASFAICICPPRFPPRAPIGRRRFRDATHTRPDRVASCLDKLEEVWGVRRVERSDVVRRKAALIKVVEDALPGELVSAVVGSGSVRVIQRSGGAAILEIVDTPEKVDDAIGSLPQASILEVARLGQLMMACGHQPTTVASPPV